MNRIHAMVFALAANLLPAAGLYAHHNTQAEFGSFGSPTIYVEGRIVKVAWGNPHIALDIVTTGGDIPAGQNWRVASHPVNIQIDHGFRKEDFAVGDTVQLHAWKHLRNRPLLWPRAIRVNDGPMRSNMRFTDMIDIANGVFEQRNMLPAANLHGSPPGRAGPDTVEKLRAMGLLDAQGNMIWPPPAR